MPVLIPLAAAGFSAYSTIRASSKAKKSENQLENMANSYKPNASILDFYNKALAKYSPNPYNSQGYTQESNQVNRNLATGLNAAQNRRGGLAALAPLVQGANDANARAAARAEAGQGQALGQLGQAAAAKAQEDFKPFEMKYNLLAMKGAGQRQVQNQSLQNAFNNASSAASMIGSNLDSGNNIWGGAKGSGIFGGGGKSSGYKLNQVNQYSNGWGRNGEI